MKRKLLSALICAALMLHVGATAGASSDRIGLGGAIAATDFDDGHESARWSRRLTRWIVGAILLPLADPAAYVDRYSEPDKVASGLGVVRCGRGQLLTNRQALLVVVRG